MFMRKLPNLLRATGLTRCVSTSTTAQVIPTKYTPHILTAVYRPEFIDPSRKRNNNRISILDLPISINHIINDVPKIILPLEDKINGDIIEDPTKVIEQKAARLIVIRKKKMKKHKLKKLRKKMKFIWAKVRQRREFKKEKAFQAELLGQIGVAEKFNAAQYAQEKIEKANVVILPRYMRRTDLPDFALKQLIAQSERKKRLIKEEIERRKHMNVNVSDYKL